ncbi:sugar ABC transporter ATP-binding protein [Ureibacillus endophyticus]|uniref:Sugar ABC transporter ATP-binding protein n=1 Tax=Ureibacillus endophyticus TaxID=1978490 RepID=A0A494YYB3_9BACL|nr:sugar ABC transporter ATP-binding protein [Lysinibacillus endophyticus]RKQ15139.1 sugar ABC transporter ATP-binding protein [Lysinibacillus endophyticus]
MQEIILKVRGLDKSYGPTKILENVDLDLYSNEILGLVGENGAGKSTLLKILAGVTPADKGSIEWLGKTVSFSNTLEATENGIGMVFQEQNLISDIPVYENMFLGRQPSKFLVDKKTMINACKEIFDELNLHVDPTVITGTLPLGIRQFLEIAKSLMQTTTVNGRRIILLDEPTEALSKDQLEIFMKIIKSNKQNASFIFVSHRLNETIELCDRLVAMKDGKVVTSMPVTEQTTEDDIHQLMVGRQRDVEFYHENLQVVPTDEIVFSLNNVSYNNSLEDISLDIKAGEIVGLAGMLGSGRSELSKLMAGIIKPDTGEISFLGKSTEKDDLSKLVKKGLCYVPPERKEEGVILPHSVKWNLSLVTPSVYIKSFLNLKNEKSRNSKMVEKMRVKTHSLDTPIEFLSGGNQQKVVLGKWLIRDDIKLIIVEEPTRGIDVGAKQEIYKLFRDLTSQGISILISTENLLELIGLCNRIYTMKDGKITAEILADVESKPHEIDIVKHMV